MMDITTDCGLAAALAERMRDEAPDLTRRWLDRIVARVELDPRAIFPTDDLLDHAPLLIARIAEYLGDPAEEITADAPMIGHALLLGELRYRQGFDAHEILKEYELLGGVLFAYLVRTADGMEEPCSRGELLALGHRLFRAVSAMQQLTTARYLHLANERVREREERLRSFNRMVSHELKNRISSVLGAAQLLEDDTLAGDPARRARFARIVRDNTEAMHEVLKNLLELSRMDPDARRHRHAALPRVAAEVCRQLREMASAHQVQVHIGELPDVQVNAGALELSLTNYVSNAIKYADPAKPERWVRIVGELRDTGGERELVLAVEDNGLGVPEEGRGGLFTRFYRAHRALVELEGTGLGLSIVRETMETLGGRAWAEFEAVEGSRFLLAVPCRREDECRAAAPLPFAGAGEERAAAAAD